MMRLSFVAMTGVSAYTSFNSPSAPGNWNFATETPVFGADVIHQLPDINVRYHYPTPDAAKVLASVEDQMSFDSRMQALSHEQAYDHALLESLKTSFLKKGAEDVAFGAMSAVAVNGKPYDTHEDTFEMMLGLTHSPRPHPSIIAVSSPSSCRKTYDGCPTGFAAGPGGCIGNAGVCGSGPFDLSALDLSGKMRFEAQCGVSFPCSSGVADYSKQCPVGFVHTSGAMCVPSASYSGPCQGEQNFSQYNAKMMAAWEQMCGAYFA